MKSSLREAATFTAFVIGLSCGLGIAVDLVTANVAVEYFTIHHPRVVESQSPWVMALVWGIGASWWCGLIAGPALWWANLRRSKPLPMRRVLLMVARAMAVIWLVMMLILVGVYLVSGLVPSEHRRATFEHDRRLMAVALSHLTEYALAASAAIILWVRIGRLRE